MNEKVLVAKHPISPDHLLKQSLMKRSPSKSQQIFTRITQKPSKFIYRRLLLPRTQFRRRRVIAVVQGGIAIKTVLEKILKNRLNRKHEFKVLFWVEETDSYSTIEYHIQTHSCLQGTAVAISGQHHPPVTVKKVYHNYNSVSLTLIKWTGLKGVECFCLLYTAVVLVEMRK